MNGNSTDLLELDNVDGIVDVHILSNVLIIDHFHHGEAALRTEPVAHQLIREGMRLLVVEEQIRPLIAEPAGIKLIGLSNADMRGTGVVAVALSLAIVILACLLLALRIFVVVGRSGDGVAVGSRINENGEGIFGGDDGAVRGDVLSHHLVDAEPPRAKTTSIVATDGLAEGDTGVLALSWHLDLFEVAGQAGLVVRRGPVPADRGCGCRGRKRRQSEQQSLAGK